MKSYLVSFGSGDCCKVMTGQEIDDMKKRFHAKGKELVARIEPADDYDRIEALVHELEGRCA